MFIIGIFVITQIYINFTISELILASTNIGSEIVWEGSLKGIKKHNVFCMDLVPDTSVRSKNCDKRTFLFQSKYNLCYFFLFIKLTLFL